MLRITNSTSSFSLNIALDLDVLRQKFPNMESTRKRPRRCAFETTRSRNGFKRLRWRLSNCTALIYASGKVVLVGATSEDAIQCKSREIFTTLGGCGKLTYKISNYVGHFKYDQRINLEMLYNNIRLMEPNRYFGSYEPERFPGFCYLTRNHSTVTIFRSGHLIITGCKTIESVETAFSEVNDLIKQ